MRWKWKTGKVIVVMKNMMKDKVGMGEGMVHVLSVQISLNLQKKDICSRMCPAKDEGMQ